MRNIKPEETLPVDDMQDSDTGDEQVKLYRTCSGVEYDFHDKQQIQNDGNMKHRSKHYLSQLVSRVQRFNCVC